MRFGHVNNAAIVQLFECQLVKGIDCSEEAASIRRAVALPSAHCESCAVAKYAASRSPRPLIAGRAGRWSCCTRTSVVLYESRAARVPASSSR